MEGEKGRWRVSEERSRIPSVSGVMERFEGEGRETGRQPVEKLPGQRHRHLLRRQVAILLSVLFGDPVEMIAAPTSSTRVGGEMGGDRPQAQRQQTGMLRRRRRRRLLADHRHLRPLSRLLVSFFAPDRRVI